MPVPRELAVARALACASERRCRLIRAQWLIGGRMFLGDANETDLGAGHLTMEAPHGQEEDPHGSCDDRQADGQGDRSSLAASITGAAATSTSPVRRMRPIRVARGQG